MEKATIKDIVEVKRGKIFDMCNDLKTSDITKSKKKEVRDYLRSGMSTVESVKYATLLKNMIQTSQNILVNESKTKLEEEGHSDMEVYRILLRKSIRRQRENRKQMRK